jgi:hypothetical protein
LAVSGYTAYVQRQQVRAVVWPILEYSTSNEPFLRLSLANKGVGPALIRRVVLKVDGRPVANWQDALQKLFGGRHYRFSFSTLNSRVLSAGESIDILVPRDAEDRPLTATSESNSLGFQMNQERGRVSVEVCYASTLGDCWVLRSGGEEAGGAAAISTTTETHDCPKSLAGTFQQ